jgi:hypothetical protein
MCERHSLNVYTRPMRRVPPPSIVLRHTLVLSSTQNRKLPQVVIVLTRCRLPSPCFRNQTTHPPKVSLTFANWASAARRNKKTRMRIFMPPIRRMSCTQHHVHWFVPGVKYAFCIVLDVTRCPCRDAGERTDWGWKF